MQNEAAVFVVDPDPATRDAVRSLVYTMNLQCEAYASGEAFFEAGVLARPGCAVLEVRVPGINGLDIQQQLTARGSTLPVIFLTSHATLSIAVRAMRAGAVHFLEKPFREHELWDAILEAITVDGQRRERAAQQQDCESRLSRLNVRDRWVLKMIAEGRSKKAIAEAMDVCVRTVELRRSQLMKKLELRSLSELVHFALTAADAPKENTNGHQRSLDLAQPR